MLIEVSGQLFFSFERGVAQCTLVPFDILMDALFVYSAVCGLCERSATVPTCLRVRTNLQWRQKASLEHLWTPM